MQAILPSGMATVDRSIAKMDIHDSGWTMPWAMYHDGERRLWLNGAYPLHTNPQETVTMLVRRDEAGWHVDISHCLGHRWTEEGYFGRFPAIRVASLTP